MLPVRESTEDLSTKITMIVFWGLVIVGLGFSALLLNSIQEDTIEKRGAIADSIAFRVSALQPDKELATMFSANKLKDIVRPFNDVAIEIYYNGKLRDFVDTHKHNAMVHEAQTEVLVRPLLFSGSSDSRYELRVIFASFNEVLHQERKKLLLALGCILLLFGVFLKVSLDRLLKQPIEKMVETAQTIAMSSENTYAKFNENRKDELGYLARFMNQAIEKMREHESMAWNAKELAEVTLESINDGVVTTDGNGNIDFMNPGAEILSGRRLKDVKSRPVAEVLNLIDIESGEPVASPVNACLANGRSVDMEKGCALLNKNGMQIPVVVSVAAIHDRKERTLGAVITFHRIAV